MKNRNGWSARNIGSGGVSTLGISETAGPVAPANWFPSTSAALAICWN
jgi:hypothetical protein